MPDFRLRIGMLFTRQDRILTIEQTLPDGRLGLKDLLSGESSAIEHRELVKDLFEGKIELLGDDSQTATLKSHLQITRISDLSQLADDSPLRIEIFRRSHYVNRVLADCPNGRNKESLKRVIRIVSGLIEDPHPPSWRTLYRWLHDYQTAGGDTRALAPAHRARGNRSPKISGTKPRLADDRDYEKARAVNALIDQVIRTKYLSASRPTISSAYQFLQARIIEENHLRGKQDQLPIPHFSTLYRHITTLDPYQTATARHGRNYANQKYRANQKGVLLAKGQKSTISINFR